MSRSATTNELGAFVGWEVRSEEKHQCSLCSQSIEPGTSYAFSKGVFEGVFTHNKFHLDCEADILEVISEDPGEYMDGFEMGQMWDTVKERKSVTV